MEQDKTAAPAGVIGTWRLDRRLNRIHASDEACGIFGLPKGAPISREALLGGAHPEDRGHVECLWEAAVRGKACDLEHRIVVDGLVKWVRQKVHPQFDAAGRGQGGFGITQDISERKRAQANQRLLTDILRTLNRGDDLHTVMRETLRVIREATDFEAVGLRLRVGDDWPYFEQNGFSQDFLREENSLCERGADGAILRGRDGKVVLECTCGLVLTGGIDPEMPCFTQGGSFWTNKASELLALPREDDPRTHPRNRCIHEGYESVGLFPMRSGEEFVGLLQLNGRRPGRFTPDDVGFYESLAANIGLALQRVAADEALRRSEERYRSLFSNMTDGFALHEIITDAEGRPCDYRFLEVNPAFERLTGLKAAEVVGRRVLEVLPSVERRWIESYGRVAMTGEPGHFEDYSEELGRWYEVFAYRPATGRFAVVFSDITKRKLAEEELHHSEQQKKVAEAVQAERQRLNTVLDMLPAYVILLSQDYRVPFANRFFEERFGQSEGRRCYEYLFGRTEPCETCETYTVLRTGGPHRWEWTGPDGHIYDIYDFPFTDGDGSPLIMEVGLDITQSKRAHEEVIRHREHLEELIAERTGELSRSNTQLRTVLDNLTEGLVIADMEGTIVHWNPEAAAMHGFTAAQEWRRPLAEFAGLFELSTEADGVLPLERWPLARILKGEELRGCEVSIRRLDQDWARVFSYGGTLARDEDGRPILAVLTTVDVTERRRFDKALAAAHVEAINERNRLHAVMETLPVGVSILDAQGGNVRANREFERIWGGPRPPAHSVEDYGAYKAWWTDTGRPVEPQEWASARAVRDGETVVGQEMEIQRFDGTRAFILNSAAPVPDADGRVTGAAVVIMDISDRKHAEEALRESEQRVRRKLESVLSPEGDLGELELADLIDAPAMQRLMDDFYAVARIPMSIIDIKGRMLVGVGWQDVCTRFHRVHPETCRNCLESDLHLSAGLAQGEFRLYKCKNQMWDIATPIMVAGRHVGNVFSGQFFFDDETIDHSLFRAQARNHGFDEREYLAALERAPRLSRQAVNRGTAFLLKLAATLSQLGYSNVKLARLVAERDRLTASLRESTDRLRASLEEKEVLLKEIHHRVKNNMQVVSSLVALHAEALQDGTLREVLQEVTHRVRSMALVHEKLYQSADLAQVEFAGYTESLLRYLWGAHGVAAGIRLELDLAPVSLPVNVAVPCGLILNELVGNALKHAFRGRDSGEVAVTLGKSEQGQVRLTVRDNGVGLPAGLDWRQGRSLGLRLAQMLGCQLGATVDVRTQTGEGTEFEVVFGQVGG